MAIWNKAESSGQDKGVGRNPSFPYTTKRRITTNLKSINNQKCQKIKLHGTPTTKKLKKKSTRTTRPVRTHGVGGAACSKVVDHEGGAGGGETETQSSLWTTAVAVVGETLSLTWDFLGKWARDEQASCIVPSLALPYRQCLRAARRAAQAWRIPKALPPYNLAGALKQRNMAQMKEQRKTSQRELSDEKIANLSDGEFKALVIKMFQELQGRHREGPETYEKMLSINSHQRDAN